MNQDLELVVALVVATCAALLTNASGDYIAGAKDVRNRSAYLKSHEKSLQETGRNLKLARAVSASLLDGGAQ